MAKGLAPAGTAIAKMMPPHQRCLPPERRVSEGLPCEVNTAVGLAELHARVIHAMG